MAAGHDGSIVREFAVAACIVAVNVVDVAKLVALGMVPGVNEDVINKSGDLKDIGDGAKGLPIFVDLVATSIFGETEALADIFT
jgi:hypothetical protein